MTDKSAFTDDEWKALTEAPLLVTLALFAAGEHGPISMVKEASASAKTIAHPSAGGPADELIAEIAKEAEGKEARHNARQHQVANLDQVIEASLADLGGAATALESSRTTRPRKSPAGTPTSPRRSRPPPRQSPPPSRRRSTRSQRCSRSRRREHRPADAGVVRRRPAARAVRLAARQRIRSTGTTEPDGPGFWAVTRYDDVGTSGATPDFSSEPTIMIPDTAEIELRRPPDDADDRTRRSTPRLRRIIRQFTPRARRTAGGRASRSSRDQIVDAVDRAGRVRLRHRRRGRDAVVRHRRADGHPARRRARALQADRDDPRRAREPCRPGAASRRSIEMFNYAHERRRGEAGAARRRPGDPSSSAPRSTASGSTTSTSCCSSCC